MDTDFVGLPGGAGFALALFLDVLAAHQLVEIALLAAAGLVLHNQREIVLVKLLEPVVPGDRLQRILAGITREVEADHAGIATAAGAADTGRLRPALLGPLPDLLVVRKRMGGPSGVSLRTLGVALRRAGGAAARPGSASRGRRLGRRRPSAGTRRRLLLIPLARARPAAFLEQPFPDLRQLLIRLHLLLQSFLQKLGSFAHSKLLRDGPGRFVSHHFVVLHLPPGGGDGGIEQCVLALFLHHFLAFFDQAFHAAARFAARRPIHTLEDLLQTLHLAARDLEVV